MDGKCVTNTNKMTTEVFNSFITTLREATVMCTFNDSSFYYLTEYMLYNKSGRIEHRYLSERIENVDVTFSYKDEKLSVKCSGFEALGIKAKYSFKLVRTGGSEYDNMLSYYETQFDKDRIDFKGCVFTPSKITVVIYEKLIFSVTFSFDIEGDYHELVLSNESDLSSFHKYLSSNEYLNKPINPTLDLRSTIFENEDLPF